VRERSGGSRMALGSGEAGGVGDGMACDRGEEKRRGRGGRGEKETDIMGRDAEYMEKGSQRGESPGGWKGWWRRVRGGGRSGIDRGGE